MRAQERRKEIGALLMASNTALSGGALSARFGVSRQIIVQDIAETVEAADGHSVSATTFLNRFLFPNESLNKRVEILSGGEQRRLYLLTVLMRNPNFLILDEPTNDLDILTLNVLEEYLQSFKGCLLIVSHDRYFLDKTVDHLFIFREGGVVKDFVGQYSEYREYVKEQEAEEALWGELYDLMNGNISDYEMEKVKNKFEANILMGEINVMNKAMNLGFYALLGDMSLLNGEATIYRSISREEVMAFARERFTPNNSTTLIYRAKL